MGKKQDIKYPCKANSSPKYPLEIYGENMFTLKTMAKALPKPIFLSFLKQWRGWQNLDKMTVDSIVHTVHVWVMDHRVMHYMHWFQLQTGTMAEKHNMFLSLLSSFTPGGKEVTLIDQFLGLQLLQSELDTSSFPLGGMRTTFEVHWYMIWDTLSLMFVQHRPNSTSILYILSVFISYNGDMLAEKTGLLWLNEVLSHAAAELVNLLEPDMHVAHMYMMLGMEQEFFLVDCMMYMLRPDLKITGRMLVGQLPPRHQQLEDHYFGCIPSCVMHAISELELECLRLGIPIKTRHNEVALAQFEVAPIFEEASVAVDHNLLTMDMLHKVAHCHNLHVLYHEKPFKGINGSGKHCNWAVATDCSENLLDLTVHPETNFCFLVFLLAMLHALQEHMPLLHAAISLSSNEHCLGMQELNEVLDAIDEDCLLKNFSVPQFQTIKVSGTMLDVKVAGLPHIARDLTDRNRTSPFAFTGNKFEFRAVGSKQSPAFPVTMLNCTVTTAITEIVTDLHTQMGSKPALSDATHWPSSGDNYSDAWVTEAAHRSLPNICSAPKAFTYLLKDKHLAMLTTNTGIFSHSELMLRYHILNECYAKDVIIEAETLKTIISQQILPATLEYCKSLAESATALKAVSIEAAPEVQVLNELVPLVTALQAEHAKLTAAVQKLIDHGSNDLNKHAQAACDSVAPAIAATCDAANALKTAIADKYWLLPKYTKLLLMI
ncbi:hypothetical protein H4S02_001693 [Coemansia sp. RSA 2611]|nr:hypothetical protein LPJ70_000630 [Coemansia sp. RSA 2708]KAJ2368067.1 hypothetical protein H4S01_001799 [Coemansia sp. RSA 2610]KAJ2390744.1 hypothetical protein H4S02_001693 [Coemansia sp. RSA 2611]